jgi:hypothetical protein
MRAMSMIPRVLVLVVALLGCNSAPEQPSREAPPPPRSSAAAPLSAAPTAPLDAAGEASNRASERAAERDGGAPQAAGPGELAGGWEGHYDAKKGTVTLPSKVKDKALAADDGKTAAGRGTVDLVILANGDVRGKASGALGAAAITGKLDGTMVSAVIRPDDPQAPNAMTGIFVGQRKGETIACEMHVAGPDGTVIRESTVELTRKK